MDRLFWYFILCFPSVTSLNHDDLSDLLEDYEFIHMNSIRTRTRRHVDPHSTEDFHQIWLSTHGRNFHLKLQKSKILSNDYKTTVIHGNGKSSEFTENNHGNHEFYTGKVADDKHSIVSVYWEDGVLTANIITAEDVYVVEPSDRYLKNSSSKMLLAYRKSRMKMHDTSSRPYCAVHNASSSKATEHNFEESNGSRRQKRQTVDFGRRKFCRIFLVADYYFFSTIGKNSVIGTQNYMIGVMDTVNQIYKSTKWPDDSSSLTGLGFEIAAIIVHDQPTAVEDGEHYNMADRKMDVDDLLTAFGKSFHRNKACLVHLFTCESFSGGYLGYAYIASWRPTDISGFCASSLPGWSEAINTGLTTALNKHGKRVLSLQTTITTAHELGHNWGSQHDDPDNAECSPSEFKGGYYMMYPTSQEGYSANNVLFSPCSRRSIYEVLKTKGFNCFRAPNPFLAVCGNGRVEGFEKCDSGGRDDPCCDKKCQFTVGTDCSPYNQECCVNCQLANTTAVCVSTINDNFDCQENAHCDGYNYVCPAPKSRPDDTPCHDGGYCRSGRCEGFCEYRKMLPCVCDKDSGHACRRCCKKDKNAACEFFDELLEDGRSCYQGYCEKGVCLKRPSPAAKLWSYLQTEIINSFDVFMKNNIVAFCTLFSAIVWVIGISTFNYFDNKEEDEDGPLRKRQTDLQSSVMLPEDKDKVRLITDNLSKIKQRRLERQFSKESYPSSYGNEPIQSRFSEYNSNLRNFDSRNYDHTQPYNNIGQYGSLPTTRSKHGQIYNTSEDTWPRNNRHYSGAMSPRELYNDRSVVFGDKKPDKTKTKSKMKSERVRPDISWPVVNNEQKNQRHDESFNNENNIGFVSSHSLPNLPPLNHSNNLYERNANRNHEASNRFLPNGISGTATYSPNGFGHYDNRSGQFLNEESLGQVPNYGDEDEFYIQREKQFQDFSDTEPSYRQGYISQRLQKPNQNMYKSSSGFVPISGDFADKEVYYNSGYVDSDSNITDPVEESYI